MKRRIGLFVLIGLLLIGSVAAWADPIHVGGGFTATSAASTHVGRGALLHSPIHVGGGVLLTSSFTPIHVGGG